MAINRITTFTYYIVQEGDRMSYSYSELNDDGSIIKQQAGKDFVVLDKDLQGHIDAIKEFILKRLEG